MLLPKFFSRRWWFATLLVIAATLVMVRLGIWQLDRLEQRRAFNAQVESARAQTMLYLDQGVPNDINGMEWRAVQMTGEYDFANQVAVRNQYYGSEYGYHLLTPLLSQGTAVLVDRGWIPAEGNSTPADWRAYDEPGVVTVTGQIRLGQAKPALGGVADALPADGGPLAVWNNADVEKIVLQMPYSVLTVYIQPAADPADTTAPIPYQPELELTEGPHFGYAMQWFTFATILLLGYPFFIRKQETTLG
jgi:surfeit locus 1 family protein